MLRGGMLAAVIAMLAACSSFAEDSPTTKDAGPAQSPRLTLRADPSLVVLEAGGRATVKVVVEHTSVPGAPLRDGFQVAGLPDGVSSLNGDKAIGIEHTFELEAARGAEGASTTVKIRAPLAADEVSAEAAEASFELRTITKTAPVLDPSFGEGGRAFIGGGVARDEGQAVVVQADGKVLVAGGYRTGYVTVPALARYAANGVLDPTFGTGGIVVLGDHDSSIAVAVALQADGKILVLEPFDLAVTRLSSSGALDTSFGIGGTAFAGFDEAMGTALALGADGKVVVVGRVSGATLDFGVARFTTEGKPDTTFGGVGRVTTPILALDDAATSVAIGANGAIAVGGSAIANGHTQVAVAKYTTSGALDTTFDSDGIATWSSNASADDVATAVAFSGANVLVAGSHRQAPATDQGVFLRYGATGSRDATRLFDLAGAVAIDAMVVQPNGAALLAGAAGGKIALARLLADGSFDTSFGNAAGFVTTTAGDASAARAIALRADGKIVTAGTKRSGTDPDVAVTRYEANGTLDTAWGTTGIVTTSFGRGDDGVRASALAKEGKIVVAGYAYNGADFDFLVARLLADGKLDPSFGGGTGRVLYDRPGTSQFAYGVSVLADQKILVSGQGGPGTIVLRLNEDGTLDPSFGSAGATTITGGDSYGLAVQAQDGKILVGGSAMGDGFFVGRLTANGVPDTSFGQGATGTLTTQFDAAARGIALALDPSGNVVVVGHVDFKKPPNFFDLAIARFQPSGALDATFDGDGKTTINTADVELFYTAALQGDGKILVAGRSSSPNQSSSLAVFRIDAYGALDTSFGKNGRAELDLGEGSQGSAVVVQPNGAILVAGRTADYGAALTLLSSKGAPVWPGTALKTSLGFGGEAFSVMRAGAASILVSGFTRVRTDEDGFVLRYNR